MAREPVPFSKSPLNINVMKGRVPKMENPPSTPIKEKPAKVGYFDAEKIGFGISTKMRIKLYDKDNSLLISDRLVEQATELNYGPKEVHNGPLSLEFNLLSQDQTDAIIEYLKKLKGDLPIVNTPTAKKSSINKSIDKMLSDKEPLLDLIKTAKSKGTSQEKLIELLREYNFKFINGDVIQDMIEFDSQIGQQIQLRQKDIDAKYQYMVRLVKEAKEPMNDKYDFRLVFGIKIVGEKIPKVQVYLWGKYDKTWSIAWEKEKEMNFKKVEKVYIFPDFLDYADRKKWRTEHRKKLTAEAKGEKFEPSKNYLKWSPYVKGI